MLSTAGCGGYILKKEKWTLIKKSRFDFINMQMENLPNLHLYTHVAWSSVITEDICILVHDMLLALMMQ